MSDDIRWKQRFRDYVKILRLLEKCIPEDQKNLTDKDRLALVQAYEMTVELGWKTMRHYMKHHGSKFDTNLGKFDSLPKETVREAFRAGIISDNEVWIDAINKRNLTSHTYTKGTAEELPNHILERFYPAFVELRQKFTQYAEED